MGVFGTAQSAATLLLRCGCASSAWSTEVRAAHVRDARHTAVPSRRPALPRDAFAGPVVLSIEEIEALLDCLPPPRDPKTGEDEEERQQIKTLEGARQRLVELQQSLRQNTA